VVRDPAIWFFEKVIFWQGSSKGLLNFTTLRSNDDTPSRGDELAIEEVGLEDAQEYTLAGRAKLKSKEFRPCIFFLLCILAWFFIIAIGTSAYVLDTQRFHKESLDIKQWAQNMETLKCGTYTHGNSFHNAMFLQIGIPTFHIASMVIFSQRKRIGL